MTRKTVFLGARIFDGERFLRDKALFVEDERFAGVTDVDAAETGTERVELAGGLIAPGFVDVQVNGGGGALFNDETSVDGIRAICGAHARYGTTALLPTLITDTPDKSTKAIIATREALQSAVPGCIGLHLEGPHLAVAKKGAHRADLIRSVDNADKALLASAAIGSLLMTVAPETVTSVEIQELTAMGLTVSLGHSDASYDLAAKACDAGARGVTHLFNAMSPLGHREPGLVGAALDTGELWPSLIADGHHVHPAAIRCAITAKRGPGKIILVTDAMSTVGWDGDEITLNDRTIRRENGRLTLEDGTLAGSDLDMASAVRFMVRSCDVGLDEALRMASLYPAEFLRIDDRHGRIADGRPADFTHLDDDLNVCGTWIAGERVY